MYTIDEVETMLGEIADELPGAFFERLNGGILLLEECKMHPESKGDLYIMGEYCHRRDLGRHINIYYGSFMRVHAHAPEETLRRELRKTLLHEFTHHLESLAGERGLEIKDRQKLEDYRRVHREEP